MITCKRLFTVLFVLFAITSAALVAQADQRMETVGGFCHAVTPEGFQANDDNEVFLSNCQSSIQQNADGTGSGSYEVEIEYPNGALPFAEDYETTGAETGVDCVMVDSNGTTYTTQDWRAEYEVDVEGRRKDKGEIEYTVVCRNGQQSAIDDSPTSRLAKWPTGLAREVQATS